MSRDFSPAVAAGGWGDSGLVGYLDEPLALRRAAHATE